jgi:hypothetical protein
MGVLQAIRDGWRSGQQKAQEKLKQEARERLTGAIAYAHTVGITVQEIDQHVKLALISLHGHDLGYTTDELIQALKPLEMGGTVTLKRKTSDE